MADDLAALALAFAPVIAFVMLALLFVRLVLPGWRTTADLHAD